MDKSVVNQCSAPEKELFSEYCHCANFLKKFTAGFKARQTSLSLTNCFKEHILYKKIVEVSVTGRDSLLEEIRQDIKNHPHVLRLVDRNYEGSSPLHLATSNGHYKVVQFLLKYGIMVPDANWWDNKSSLTPLMCAAINGHLDILRLLLKHGANINAGLDTKSSLTALLFAARNGDTEMVFELLKNNALQDSYEVCYSETPIHVAVIRGFVEILDILIGFGGDVNRLLGNDEWKTPLHIAASGKPPNFLQCCKVLLEKGKAEVNASDKKGRTPLHIAACKGLTDVVVTLLNYGADFSIENNQGNSVLHYLKKFPSTPVLLWNVFNKAVDHSQHDSMEFTSDCKVTVDYRCVLPSDPIYLHGNRKELRPETSKIQCLVDNDYEGLLLHPVVHSFLMLKWRRARKAFVTIFVLKAMLTIVLTLYVQLPYLLARKYAAVPVAANLKINDTELNSSCQDAHEPIWFLGMYIFIAILSVLNSALTFVRLIHCPKSLLRTVEPWIAPILSAIVSIIRPNIWMMTCDRLQRAIIATSVCLTWMDTWIYLGNFPVLGLSIRIFCKVLKNFVIFTLSHFCLFGGFVMAFTIAFPKEKEFSSWFLSIAKAIRIMAGDTSLPMSAITHNGTVSSYITDSVMSYTFTLYVLTVGIVLSNLLIGLAVKDIQGIYAKASLHCLINQTALIGTLETNYFLKFAERLRLSCGWTLRLTRLFPNLKTLTFKPFDSKDKRLSSQLKQAFLEMVPYQNDVHNEDFSCPTNCDWKRWSVNTLTISSSEKLLLRKLNDILKKLETG